MRSTPLLLQWKLSALSLFMMMLPLSASAEITRLIEVSLGGSTHIDINLRGARATLTDETITRLEQIPNGLLVIGLKVGETNLVFQRASGPEIYLIKVSLPAQAIQSELATLFPDERDVRARAIGGALVLEGSVSSAPVVARIEEVARGYLLSPSIVALGVRPNVINLLRVSDPQQVQMEVRFAEVSRNSLRAAGMNMDFNGGGRLGARGGSVTAGSDRNVGILSFHTDDLLGLKFPFSAILQLFSERSLSRTLAEPTLVAMSGESATFLAGGEQPVPQATGFGTPTIEYKKFGIQLDFTPRVLDGRTIELETKVEVSALDFSQGIEVGGLRVPLFKSRQSRTTVRLRSGQSFAIAGLLSDEIENAFSEVPGLGRIPVLGLLFNSRSFKRRETELVVVVTARLVNPLESNEMNPLPGEDFVDPSDWEAFFMSGLSGLPPDDRRRRRSPGAGDADFPSGRSPRSSGTLGFWR